jgi:hypothetical protein
MNRNPRVLSVVFPWLLSIGLGAWLVVILTSDAAVSAHPAERASPTTTVESPGEDLALVRTCRSQLKQCGRKLVACRSVAASSQASLEKGRSPAKILSDPKVKAMIASEVEMALAARDELLEQERTERLAGWHKLASRFLSDGLDLNQEESRWVGEYVCAVHELSSKTGADVASTKEEVLALFARLRNERKAILRDLEAYMGPERYQKLRAIGGLGFLGEALGCR